jgi:choline dehydrogenase-like flavoprotein
VKRFDLNLNLKARKEVVLSAGAINSPQILLLSGIGPKKQLELVELPIIHELQGVGENLQDHVMTSIWLNSENFEQQLGANPFDLVNPLNYIKYFIGVEVLW